MSYARFKFKKLSPDAKIPDKAAGDVGYDLTSIESVHISAHSTLAISTGLQLANAFCDVSSFMKIEGRSGLASRGIFPVGGIIDNSYRGEIKVLLHNSTNDTYEIKSGHRIAQLVCYCMPNSVRFIEEMSDVSETDRGENGFGSSGD